MRNILEHLFFTECLRMSGKGQNNNNKKKSIDSIASLILHMTTYFRISWFRIPPSTWSQIKSLIGSFRKMLLDFIKNCEILTFTYRKYLWSTGMKAIYIDRSSCSQMLFKIVVLKNFAIFKGKHIWWSLFLIKLQIFRPETLLKRDFDRGVFLWILRNFKKSFFIEHLS